MSSKSVRLRHPQLRNVNYAVELPGKPYHNPAGYDCPKCNRGRTGDRIVHRFKTMHLDLDETGHCFIGASLLEELRKVPTMAGLEVENGTDAAPMQVIGAVAAPQQETVLTATGQQFYIPERTKWEADRLVTDAFKRQLLEPLAEQYDRRATKALAEKRTIFKLEGRKD